MPLPEYRCPARLRAGFTLVELLAVMAILGTLAALGVPKVQESAEKARVAKAIGDIRSMAASLGAQDSLPDGLDVLGPVPLDPWGNPYEYTKFPPGMPVPPGARRDRFMVPVNTEYDLYSKGKDGATSAPLTAGSSQDDVVLANDGGFIGLASTY